MKITFRTKLIISFAILLVVAVFVERRYGFLNYFLSTRGFKTDHLIVNGDEVILSDIEISAICPTNQKRIINDDVYDSVTIFKNGQYLHNWEPGYGKNWLVISICDITVNGPSHFKFSVWEKHDYIINITKHKNAYYVDWEIRGAYPMEGKSKTQIENCN